MQGVVAGFAHEHIGPVLATRCGVVVVAVAQHRVIASAGPDGVVATTATHSVVARTCAESFCIGATHHQISAIARLSGFDRRQGVDRTRHIQGCASLHGVGAVGAEHGGIGQVDAHPQCALCKVDGRTLERNDPVDQLDRDGRLDFDVNTLQGIAHPGCTALRDCLHHSPRAFEGDRALAAALDGEFAIGTVCGGHLTLKQEHHFAVVQREVIGAVTREVNGFKAAQTRASKARHVQINTMSLELQGVIARAAIDQDKVKLGNGQHIVATATANDVGAAQAVDGVIACTTSQTVGVEVTNQQVVARGACLHQGIGEVATVDDEGLARAVTVALVGGHARQDVNEAIVVEVTRGHRKTKLVLWQTTRDDEAVVP